MATVAFVIHGGRPEAASLAQKAADWLEDRGHRARLPVPRDGSVAMDGVDLAVSLGGDGTMLRTACLVHGTGVPVLGVNLGHLGYLAAVEPGGLHLALERFLLGDYEVHERMALDVRLELGGGRGGGAPGPCVALNEAVVERVRSSGHTVLLAMSVGGHPFITYASDGLIMATPTGSTAYNLSSRGPIASPQLRALIVTPVSPHMLFDRSLVLDPSEEVRVQVTGGRPAVLVVDGQTLANLEPDDVVTCRASPHPVRLVEFGASGFHDILRTKFGLAERSDT